MRLPDAAYAWALRHLRAEGDSDLFPAPSEIDALRYSRKTVLADLARLDLRDYDWRGGRRFVVPKGVLAFRHGTQLHPLDSLILAALVKHFGGRLERYRVPRSEARVFSYRFSPTRDGRLYGDETHWHDFWEVSRERASADSCTHVLLADISDFYNQIYHHVLENQLDAAGLDKDGGGVFQRFMATYSDRVSRGLPIGPHSVHLLAELSLHPIDEDLIARGYKACRYVDDFHVFCNSEEHAVGALYDLAHSLDSHQRLILERRKTRILPAEEFVTLANAMLIDNPLDENEKELLELIKGYTDDDPYKHVSLKKLDDDDLSRISKDILEALLEVYLDSDPANYSRIGWLLRRLHQVGAPGAIDFIVRNLAKFAPVLGDAARYITASAPNYGGDLVDLGERLLETFKLPIVARSPYLRVVLLDILARVPKLDHADTVTADYEHSDPNVRREILRVAGANQLGSWLRGLKAEFRSMDPWARSAYLSVLPALPGDEALHWIKGIRRSLSPLERLLVVHAFRDRGLKLGDLTLK